MPATIQQDPLIDSTPMFTNTTDKLISKDKENINLKHKNTNEINGDEPMQNGNHSSNKQNEKDDKGIWVFMPYNMSCAIAHFLLHTAIYFSEM